MGEPWIREIVVPCVIRFTLLLLGALASCERHDLRVSPVDWSEWVPDPPPGSDNRGPGQFTVTVVAEQVTFALSGGSYMEYWTSPDDRRIARFRYEEYEGHLEATHSYGISAEVRLLQECGEPHAALERFDIEVEVNYRPRGRAPVRWSWSGSKPLGEPQTISRDGIDVVIAKRPN